ncbi:MAG TPA: response regulator [Vicinamibacteria bacterium]|nr:response regulator [Vicinamibacteria bacterium]
MSHPMHPPSRMVVVDDDPKVRVLLERAFRAPEFETHAFPTGAAALRRVAELRPDCVVSDILMPDMDGEGFLRAMRALPGLERVPFIAVSAVRSEARIKAVLAAGASAFLLKPFPLRELIEKVRTLLERPPAGRPAPDATGDLASPTRPLMAAPHTSSTAAVRRKPPAPAAPAPPAPARAVRPADAPVTRPVAAPARVAPGASLPGTTTWPALARPGVPAPPPARTSVRVSPVRVVVNPGVRAAPRTASGERHEVRRVELGPPDAAFGFGRFTRVESRGRSFVVLTEAAPHPKFTVTTVITEKGVPLRKIESALPHPLAREEDRALVRRQLDLQHDDTLRRLDELVLDTAPRRVLWSDQSRSVEAGVLAWAMSAVAQLAETQAGTDETARQLRLTRETAFAEEDALRAFQVTAFARVVVDPQHAGRVPRRAVRAVAGWCRAFATAALQVEAREIVEPVRQATRRYSLELERMGFYDRLLPRARA